MVIEMKMPSPGETITEVEIAQWLVADGDYVERDQLICEIDSDKATLELNAEESGTIKIIAKEGQTIAIGDLVCTIDTNVKGESSSKPKEVKEKVIDISHGRASLSLKALKEDPWKAAETKYKKFAMIQGKITKLNPFGAFVEIESQIQGLCHISEFGTKTKMEEELTVGKTYPFQILEINPTEHRMSLKLQAQDSVLKDVAPTTEPQQPPQVKEEAKEEAAEH